MSAPVDPGTGSAGGEVPPVRPHRGPRSVFRELYVLMLRTQVTRARLVALAALAVLGIVVAAAVGNAHPRDALEAGTELINEFGLWLLVPVPALVFASAALGDPTDDQTLVYLWLRPVRRSTIVLAGYLAALTATWPLVVPPLAAAAALTGGGTDLVVGTAIAATVTLVGYLGLFLVLGLRFRFPLAWGLLYIFIWEGFIARGSETAAKLALRAYGASLLRDRTGVELLTSTIDPTWSLVVPALIAVVTLTYASWRLARQDVA